MLIILPLFLNNQTSLNFTFEMLMRHKVFLNHIAIRSRQHAYSAVGFGLLQRNIQKRLQAAVVIFAQTNLINLLRAQWLAITGRCGSILRAFPATADKIPYARR